MAYRFKDPFVVERQDMKDLCYLAEVLCDILSKQQLSKEDEERLRYCEIIQKNIETSFKQYQI